MRVGVSGLTVGNQSGLGRLSRIYLLALAHAAPDWELHVFLRQPADLALLQDECDQRSQCLLDALALHYPPRPLRSLNLPGVSRWLFEEWWMPRVAAKLGLAAYLGCDFTLPRRTAAPREAVVVPDILPFTRPETVGWRARVLYRRGLAHSVAQQAQLLCISQATRAALIKRFPEAAPAARVVYPALSPRLWQLAQQQQFGDRALQVRGSLHHLTAPGPFLLAVGTQGPRKNTSLLVRVHRELVLNDAYHGSLVLVGGDGRFHSATSARGLAFEAAGAASARPSQPPAVYDLGHVTDYELSDLYRHADLLVSLSEEEGFGFPVLEALAHGTPALVTQGSSMMEIAARGIAGTELIPKVCFERTKSALAALPLLRQEAAALPLEQYALSRLGRELRAMLEGQP